MQHRTQAQKWNALSFLERMAHVGSEVERTLRWRERGKTQYCEKAFHRALELLTLTIENEKSYPRLKELCRTRELFIDFIKYSEYKSNSQQWRKYFDQFLFALRNTR